MIDKLRRLFGPIKYIKKSYAYYVFHEFWDVFQSIFLVQVGVYIIGAIEQGDTERALYRIYIIIGIFVINRILLLIRGVVMEYVNNQLEFELKQDYFTKFVGLDNNSVESIGTGKFQNILLQGVQRRVGLLTRELVGIVVSILGVIYSFVIIAIQAPTVYHFRIFVAIFITASAFLRIGLNALNATRKESKEITMELGRQEIKIIMSKFEILQNNKITQEMQKFYKLVERNIYIWQRGNFIKGLWQTGTYLVTDGAKIFIYLSIGIGVISGKYTIAYMLLFLELLGIISSYIWNLRYMFKGYFNDKVHVEKLRETFDEIKSIDYESGEKFSYINGSVKFSNLSYGYGDTESKVLQGFSIDIKGIQKTALVGVSGSGKSTIVKLIAGYLTPDSGSVIVDEQDLQKISLKSYYKHIGYLTQDPSVFDGTVIDNLTYAIEGDVDEERLKNIIKLAKCDFIRDFPNGLETEIGERGIRLSGGQRQRLAIAKVFLKDPKIIILDEPTSSLDSFSEEAITEAMHNLFENRTVLIIAHRLQTVKNADDIIVLDEGKVIERGTHDELVRQGGSYAKMLELQSGF